MQQLCPPSGFGMIEPNVFRSNALSPINFSFIKGIGFKTVLQVSPEIPVKAVSAFFEENGIKFINLGLKTWKANESWKPVTEELIKEALEIVLNVNTHPILILCTSGVHQTGTVVGCLRRLQHWNLTSILHELQSYGSTRYLNEQFIELFDIDLVTLPRDLPPWFIEQQKMLEEEEREESYPSSSVPPFVFGSSSSVTRLAQLRTI